MKLNRSRGKKKEESEAEKNTAYLIIFFHGLNRCGMGLIEQDGVSFEIILLFCFLNVYNL
jgi:hypothetical protein